ncbi:hypothetical protein ACGC1H_007437 [Rhizoctonia solani]
MFRAILNATRKPKVHIPAIQTFSTGTRSHPQIQVAAIPTDRAPRLRRDQANVPGQSQRNPEWRNAIYIAQADNASTSDSCPLAEQMAKEKLDSDRPAPEETPLTKTLYDREQATPQKPAASSSSYLRLPELPEPEPEVFDTNTIYGAGPDTSASLSAHPQSGSDSSEPEQGVFNSGAIFNSANETGYESQLESILAALGASHGTRTDEHHQNASHKKLDTEEPDDLAKTILEDINDIFPKEETEKDNTISADHA